VHVVVDGGGEWNAALTIPHDTVRVSFAVPWEGMLLLGTTDTLYEGEPDDAAATPEDIDQILAEAAVALEPGVLRPDAIRSVYAGLRVLPGAEGATASARRETVYLRGPGGMLTVAGGKLTTYRRIAIEALGQVRGDLGLHRLPARPVPLPGAEGLGEAGVHLARAHPDLEPALRSHLSHLYGSLAAEVLGEAADDPSLLERLNPEAPDIAAQAAARRSGSSGSALISPSRGQAAASPALLHGVALAIAASRARHACNWLDQPGRGRDCADSTATSASPQARSISSRCATSPIGRSRRV